jgi:hypothetical protein
MSNTYPSAEVAHFINLEKGGGGLEAVTTSGIVVVDGTEHVLLGPLAGSTGVLGRVGLTIMEQNNSLLSMGARGLSLADKWGDTRMTFAVVPEKSYETVFMMGDRGKPRVVLGVGADGSGSLGVFNGTGGVLWSIP